MSGCLGLLKLMWDCLAEETCPALAFEAYRMMLTGYRVTARTFRLGIVEGCYNNGELMDEALKLAVEVASKSPLATKLAKHSLNQIEHMTLRDGLNKV